MKDDVIRISFDGTVLIYTVTFFLHCIGRMFDESIYLRVFLSILLRLSDPCENWVLGYFGYADFKNLISLTLGRRILELAMFAWNTVLQVFLTEK